MPLAHLFRRYLRERGLPVTQQREAIAETVFSSPDHLSVEDIDARLKERGYRTGKATIYRTLEMLVRSGLVAEHDFGEGFKRYEHLSGQSPGHGHLVCLECGYVAEIEEPELLTQHEHAARSEGFHPVRYRLEVYGLCADCRAAGKGLDRDSLSCPIEDG